MLAYSHGIAPTIKPRKLFQDCDKPSALSICFDVKAGHHGCVEIYELPDGWCMCIEKYVYTCCSQSVDFYPAVDDCGCPVATNCAPSKLYLPEGRYHALLLDENGEPVIPEEGEVVACVTNVIGPMPRNCNCK